MVTHIGTRRPQRLFLREWRESFGLSVEQVANRIDVSRETIWRWENQQHRLNPDKMHQYAVALDIEPEQLWRLPSRPSADAILKDASKEQLSTAIDVVKRILQKAS